MKKNNHLGKKSVALLLCAVLTMSLSAPLALAAEEKKTVEVRSVEDWNQLVEHCRLDSWSDGLTVSLEADLDLTGCASIPTFGGTFKGNQHTLRGLELRGEGDTQGLFRYLRESAVVQDLAVSGVVTPSGNPSKVGGIVGKNSGTLLNCRFLGIVSGKSSTGGLVGVNTVSARLENCEMSSGAVTGEHYTGGLVGENYGTVLNCINRVQVNTQAVDPSLQLDEVDWEKLNRTENVPASTDVGGIAGYSRGLLQDCVNRGAVGYPHMGYNVGGIAGRQAGLMVNCQNLGLVQGRKDVGGIVGQAEPFTELRYEESTLQKLGNELERLSTLMDHALDSGDNTRKAISDHLTTINSHTGNAKDSVSGLLDDIEDLGDGSVDTVNDLSNRVKVFMEDLEDVTGEMERASDRLSDGLNRLERAANKAGQAEQPLNNAVSGIQTAMNQATAAIDALRSWVPMPLGPDLPSLPDIPDLSGTIDDIQDVLGNLSYAIEDALPNLQAAIDALEHSSHSADEIGTILGDSLAIMEDALNDLSHGADHMGNSFDDLQQAIQAQTDLPTLELPKLPEDFHDRENALRDTLTALNDEMEQMNQTADQGGDALSERMKEITRQFTAVTDVIRNAGKDLENREVVVDLSEEDADAATWGKLQGCSNLGKVEGDVNVGGVAGSMAIEYDFDPEDDATKKGDPSINFRYLTRAILLNCKNSGSVVSRKDAVGGIVGRMDLGVVLGGQNFGPVESTAGEGIGGIAGISTSLIRDSWAKCPLTGIRRVGGIAGEGHDIRGCRTWVEIRDAAAYSGAIAGKADGAVSGNIFVDASLGGVDGISYHGSAEPVEHAALAAMNGVPAEFLQLTVTFKSGPQIVRTLKVNYGGALTENQIPAVPERSGYYGSWSDFDHNCLRFDTEVEAVYTPWLSAAASPNGKILAEGSFRPETELIVQEDVQMVPPDAGQVLGVWQISLPAGESPFTALRVALPNAKTHGELWMLSENGTWQRLPATPNGSYLRAEVEGTTATVCLVKTTDPTIIWISIGIASAILLLAVLLMKKCKAIRKKKKSSPPKAKKHPKEKKGTKKELTQKKELVKK